MRTLHACTEGLICSIITRRRHCKENKHTEADVARSRNNSSDDLLCTEQSKVRVVNLEHFPPPTADMHIYNCMLASTMHVWPAKQPLINKGLRQWLPSGVRNSSHRFSFSLTISLSIYSLYIYISLSLFLLLYPSFAPAPAPRWPLNQSVSSIVYPSGTHPCNKHWSAKNSLSDAGLEPPRHMAMHNLTKCDPVKVALCDHGQDNSKRAPGGPLIITG